MYLKIKFRLILLDDLKDLGEGSGNDARVPLISVSNHREGFSGSRMAVCKDAYVEAIDRTLD